MVSAGVMVQKGRSGDSKMNLQGDDNHILQILKLKTGVQVVCKGFWVLGGSSTPSGPLEIRGAKSGGLGRTPEGSFLVIY